MEIKGKLIFSMKASLLRQIVELVRVVTSEGLFHFEKDGIHVQLVDGPHVCMVVAHVKREAMGQYSPGDDLVLNLDKVKSLLASADDEEMVELYAKKGGTPAPIFKIGNLSRTMTYIDPKSVKEPKVPDLAHDTEITLNLDSIRRGIKNLGTFTDFVAIECEGITSVTLRGEGQNNDVLEITPEAKVQQAHPKKVRSVYALDYFVEMIKHLGKDVTISYSNDYPMLITAKLEDVGESIIELGTIKYLLAPKIEDV